MPGRGSKPQFCDYGKLTVVWFQSQHQSRAKQGLVMDLQNWQIRLDVHFGALRARRSAEVGEEPIFALEHGLNEQEIDAVSAAVRVEILTGQVTCG